MNETLGSAQELAQKHQDGDKILAALPGRFENAEFAEANTESFVVALKANEFVSNYCASKREAA